MRPIVLPVVQYPGPEHDVKLLINQYKVTIPEFSIDFKGRLFIRPFFMPPLPGRPVISFFVFSGPEQNKGL
jgi:hypothetical protein